MTDPHYSTVYGGIDKAAREAASGDAAPGWFRYACDADPSGGADVQSLHEVAGDLRNSYGITKVPVAYYDDEAGEYVETDQFAATVNPEWLGEGRENSPQATALWDIPSAEYEPVDAMDIYGPLVAVARRNGLENSYGSVTTYRNGGEFYVETLFDDLTVEGPEGEVEFVLGFESGADYFRRQSVWAALLAYNRDTGAPMRGLSKRFSSPHRGDVAERLADWFEGMVERARRMSESIVEVVAEARAYTVPMRDLPFSVSEWYEAQGFPATWGDEAVDRLPSVREPSAFDLYLSISEVMAERFEGKKSGDAARRHASAANGILVSPQSSEAAALRQVRDDLKGQATLGILDGDDEDAAESIAQRIETLDEGVEAFSSMRERIARTIEDLEPAEDAEGDA